MERIVEKCLWSSGQKARWVGASLRGEEQTPWSFPSGALELDSF